MKRADRNMQSRQRILDNALQEFAGKGYGLSSINTICETGGISKGIMYHYFKDKDEMYLTCVRNCFDALTAHLKSHVSPADGNAQSRLTAYFDARLAFFQANPLYRRLFLEVILSPPSHLQAAIAECRETFDAMNYAVFSTVLECVTLRADMKKEEVIETFRHYQDFVNATTPPEDTASHEDRCRRAVSVLFYGVVAREEEQV